MKAQRGGTLLGLLFGLVIGTVAGLFLATHRPGGHVAVAENKPAEPPPAPAAPPEPESRDAMIKRKLREWKLTPEDIKRELGRAGNAIKRESGKFGARVADAVGDAKIIAVVKAKYTLDKDLSATDISVGCHDGHVTLGGSVDSPEMIGRAIGLALDSTGVIDVVSSLTVKSGEKSSSI